ncbi:hypothetical protein PMAYCL1PPCAC_16254 [Pristionchus mayeri]|uniref:G protein-coupled receptor n=1 Tax=Pristionchus mayeri TaxID=1317129 RepID=A0AAN5CKK7_9BILA|nr:hypothetical protein PMAYCL1PPCAC_16254 [Pristionchus mayeri]
MDFHLAFTNYVGGYSTIVNGLYVFLILFVPPDNLGIFRSQFYVGAFASFLFAATQLWSANLFYPNGTLFLLFSARHTGPFGFLLFSAAATLQFTMLSSNFAVRYAAVRGGWMRDYLTNHLLFYGIQTTMALGAFIPPAFLFSPTPELRAIANATYGNKFSYDFLTEYFFVSSYNASL